jgi:hypothetical protein
LLEEDEQVEACMEEVEDTGEDFCPEASADTILSRCEPLLLKMGQKKARNM